MQAFQILSGFFPVIFFFGIFWFVAYLGKQSFKELLERYMSAEIMPTNALRLQELRYKGFRLRNSAKLAEVGDKLLIKAMMIPVVAIPFSDINSVEKYNDAYLLKLKGNLIGPSFYLSANQVEQFPRLRSKVNVMKGNEPAPSAQLSNKRTEMPSSIPMDANMPQLKNSVSNGVRNAVFLLITVGAAYYVIRYLAF